MMKKEYEKLEMEVIKLSTDSILVTSGDDLPPISDDD